MNRPQITVTNNTELSRYEGSIEGELAGYCDYRLAGTDIIFPHTETLPAFRGNGVADAVVSVAVADARKEGLNIVSQCWFVDEFLERSAAPSE